MFGLIGWRFAAASMLMVTDGPCAFPTQIPVLTSQNSKQRSASTIRFGRVPRSIRVGARAGRLLADRRCRPVIEDLFECSAYIVIEVTSWRIRGGALYISLW